MDYSEYYTQILSEFNSEELAAPFVTSKSSETLERICRMATGQMTRSYAKRMLMENLPLNTVIRIILDKMFEANGVVHKQLDYAEVLRKKLATKKCNCKQPKP